MMKKMTTRLVPMLQRELACLGAIFLITAGGLQGAATNRYVAANAPNPAYPYDSWANAGSNIIEVVAVKWSKGFGDGKSE